MDKCSKAKRMKQAQGRLIDAALSIAHVAGMKSRDFSPLTEQVPMTLRDLHQLEALAGILETAAARLAKHDPDSEPKVETQS